MNNTKDLYERGILVKRTTATDFLRYHKGQQSFTNYEESEGIAKECCRNGPCSYEETKEYAKKNSRLEFDRKTCEFSIK